MNHNYGRSIFAWSTADAAHPAPAIFTGECTRYEYDDQYSLADVTGASGDVLAQIFSKSKAPISFEAKVTSGSTNFLDLSGNNAQITVTGLSTGTVLADTAEEIWTLDQPKIASVHACHYPDMITVGGAMAGVANTAFTPDQTSGGQLVLPGGTIIYSTVGLTEAAGEIHLLRLTQKLRIIEHDVNPAGKIVSATATGYKRMIELRILAISTAPAKGTQLTLSATGTFGMGADYEIYRVTTLYAIERAVMYNVFAEWIPPYTA